MYKKTTIGHTDHPLWPQVWDIYQQSFPIHERRKASSQQLKLLDTRFHCDCYHKDDRLVGLMFWWDLDTLVYLEHFAITPAMRNQQHGGKLLQLFCEEMNKTIVIDMDPPVDPTSIRRERFYHQLGFVTNPYFHIQPPYREGHEGFEMKILSYPKKIGHNQYQYFSDILEKEVMTEAA